MGELSLDALRNYLRQHDIDLATCINKIIIKVSDEHDKGYAKPLKYFLDYVDDERHFLLDGKWHVFNENYIEFLKKQIDEHITIDAPGNYSVIFELWLRNDETGELKFSGNACALNLEAANQT